MIHLFTKIRVFYHFTNSKTTGLKKMSAAFNIWTTTRVFMVKARPPRMVNSASGYPNLRQGALKIGVFGKTEKGWVINSKHQITLDPNELGQFLIPAQQVWTFTKLERLMESDDEQPTFDRNSKTPSGEMLKKVLNVNINSKTNAVLVNLQVHSSTAEELHNVSADIDQGSWLAFRQVVKTSIPMLCGFDSSLLSRS